MDQHQRVLVIEGLSETVQVLRAVLEPQGLSVDRVRAHQPAAMAAGTRPRLMVVHQTENSRDAVATEAEAFAKQDGSNRCPEAAGGSRLQSAWDDVPTVVIGSADGPSVTTVHSDSQRYLQKPFQYSELIQTIETLLADHGEDVAVRPAA